MMIAACNSNEEKSKYFVVTGNTMGTTYEIAYDSIIDLKSEIDFTLGFYNYLLSTYDSTSIISKFNDNYKLTQEDWITFNNAKSFFIQLDTLTQHINAESKGAFHPGLSDLINYWGFGEKRKNPDQVDSIKIQELKNVPLAFLIDFDSSTLMPKKQFPGQRLNFNAIAPGQAVDLIARLLDSVYHLKNYYINISGEIRAKGNNGSVSYWPIKIEKPLIKALKPVEYCQIPLKNYGLATSGNYRQFYIYKDKKYGHSINPNTGYPSTNGMLSATVLAPSAAEADAYATACMVLGLEESIQMIEKNPILKALFIYEKDGKMLHWSSKNLSFEMSKQ
jgi:thiamine biosynthesis lipoprotein